ncbi:MAG: FtsX-like permease family protein, partial [Acidimicrobiales bacterium]
SLALGAVAVIVLTMVLGAVSSIRLSSLRRSERAAAPAAPSRRSTAVAASARAGAPAPAVLGVAMALEPGRGRSAVPVRPAIAGAILGTAGIVAALTFGASLDHLVGTPAAYGWTFDLAPSVYEEERGVLVASDDISDVGVIDLAQVEVGGRAVQGMALRQLKGSPGLRVVVGRPPAAPGEVALGGADLAILDLALGDRVAVARGDGGEVVLEVVGRAIFPVLDGNPFDSGALLDADLLEEVAQSAGFDQVVMSWSQGVDEEVGEASLREQLPDALPVYAYPTRPGSVANLAGVAPLPRVLSGFLVVVALAAIGHALVAGVLRRRRDLAVVRVFGFVRRQVAATVTWQSLTLAAIGLLAGIPLGVAAGRTLWRTVAAGAGVPASVVLPLPLLAALIPITLAAGVAFAVLPARAAARHRPADGLRVE